MRFRYVSDHERKGLIFEVDLEEGLPDGFHWSGLGDLDIRGMETSLDSIAPESLRRAQDNPNVWVPFPHAFQAAWLFARIEEARRLLESELHVWNVIRGLEGAQLRQVNVRPALLQGAYADFTVRVRFS